MDASEARETVSWFAAEMSTEVGGGGVTSPPPSPPPPHATARIATAMAVKLVRYVRMDFPFHFDQPPIP
ncbi:MAG: hypothetical protein WBA53_09480 [Burkholderiaceae bacterium]